ncbi:MAG: peptide chain release factor N(5)-glutamine methyltransferase [Bacteroidaceae bacterium]|nr:peptide chain release factor N(5)-glutamine methyltransferase [Bacteroidaceae bacterium]
MYTSDTPSISSCPIAPGDIALGQLHRQIVGAISARYDVGEARALAFVLLEDAFDIGRTDVYVDKVRYFSPDECQRLLSILQSLGEGVPLQYALGEAKFCGRSFIVDSSTLIPRPETEELVQWCVAEVQTHFCTDQEVVEKGKASFEKGLTSLKKDKTSLKKGQTFFEEEKTLLKEGENILAEDKIKREEGETFSKEEKTLLDVGTGSGCIAVSLALALGAEWQVEAWDISEEALNIARQNALRHGAQIKFRQQDALDTVAVADRYHVIVSNPPYICDSERDDMEAHVLDYEPHTALFVPDADPMLFYCALAQLARRALVPGGLLMVEINRAYAAETIAAFEQA